MAIHRIPGKNITYQEAYDDNGDLYSQVHWYAPVNTSSWSASVAYSNGAQATITMSSTRSIIVGQQTQFGASGIPFQLNNDGSFSAGDGQATIYGTPTKPPPEAQFTLQPVGTGLTPSQLSAAVNCILDFGAAIVVGVGVFLVADAAVGAACAYAPPACGVVSAVIFGGAFGLVSDVVGAAQSDCASGFQT